jgi:1-phosphofructokinase family hexose kinase
MFLCVSANPAVDKQIRMTEFRMGAVNRAADATPEPGGKAAHVAMALRALGERPRWIGFAGGSTGDVLVRGLNALRIRARAIAIEAPTRENLAIVDHAGRVTEILEPGGALSAKEVRSFRRACADEFARGKRKLLVILSGSLPPGVPANFYASLIRIAHSHGCRVILDSSGEALRRGVAARPDLVKPNREEAEALTGKTIRDVRSARGALEQIHAMGARSVAISLGKDGVLWGARENQQVLHARAPEVSQRSAVGSGDATVAGFAYGVDNRLSPEKVLKLAVACGSANCLADSPGRIRLSAVRKMEKEVRVRTLSE